jgi:hypothetical protein
MQNAAWIGLFRRLPPDQHHNLMLVTTIGTEIAIQNILRIEDDFVAIRGRLAGSSDTGRVFFVPFTQINFAGFQKALKEEEFNVIFRNSEGETAVQPVAPLPVPQAVEQLAKATPTKVSGTASADGRTRSLNRPPLPLKSELLERLRTRTSQQGVTPRPSLEQ